MGDLLLGGVDGGHHILHGIGHLALELGDKPLADGAIVLLDLTLLGENLHVHLGGVDGGFGHFGGGSGQVLGLLGSGAGYLLRLFGQVFRKRHSNDLLSESD